MTVARTALGAALSPACVLPPRSSSRGNRRPVREKKWKLRSAKSFKSSPAIRPQCHRTACVVVQTVEHIPRQRIQFQISDQCALALLPEVILAIVGVHRRDTHTSNHISQCAASLPPRIRQADAICCVSECLPRSLRSPCSSHNRSHVRLVDVTIREYRSLRSHRISTNSTLDSWQKRFRYRFGHSASTSGTAL